MRGPPWYLGLRPSHSASRRRLARRRPIRTSVGTESTTRRLATTRNPCQSSTRPAVTTTATAGVTRVLPSAAACGRPCSVDLPLQVGAVRLYRLSWRRTTHPAGLAAMIGAEGVGPRRTSTITRGSAGLLPRRATPVGTTSRARRRLLLLLPTGASRHRLRSGRDPNEARHRPLPTLGVRGKTNPNPSFCRIPSSVTHRTRICSPSTRVFSINSRISTRAV